jgi:hypothetical protein
MSTPNYRETRSESAKRNRFLLVDPTTRTNHVPLLRREGLALVVLDVIVQILMKNGEVVERHGGIRVMLGVEVRLPQEPPDESVRLHGARVEHGVVSEIAVGMLGVTNVIDGTVPDDARHDPPEEQILGAIDGRSESGENDNIGGELEGRPSLQLVDHEAIEVLGLGALHAPSHSRVVGGDANRRADEAAHAQTEVVGHEDEFLEISGSGSWSALELEALELLPRIVARQLRIPASKWMYKLAIMQEM